MAYINYLLDMTPTHKDGLSEENEARFLSDEEDEDKLHIDLAIIILKVIGLTSALFLALLPASPKVPGMGSNVAFVVPGAIALSSAMMWAAWFETLIYRRFTLTLISVVLVLVITGVILHMINPSAVPATALLTGFLGLAIALASTIYLLMKQILYPKWDFFLPATAILCIISIIQVI